MAWRFHPDLLARPVPRYTSYPTAAEFHDGVGETEQRAALRRLGSGDVVSLYVHIPFCREICWYCGCNTGAANRPQRLAAYLQRLDEEMARVAGQLRHGIRVGRVAFGGGSPNAIDPAQFLQLVERLHLHFPLADPVLSVEVDPRGFDAAWAGAIRAARVSRVSLGVQTFAPHVQAAIGRIQPEALIADTVTLLRANGVGSINFDLMYGLPGQTIGNLDDTLATAIALAPDRLAVFGYAHVPDRLPRQRRIDAGRLPDLAMRFAMAERAHDRLTAAGYSSAGFDHYARPGDALAIAAAAGTLNRNFQGFTEDRAEVLIGLGASAISQFPGLIVQNEHQWGRWGMRVSAGGLGGARGILRSADDRRRGDIIAALLTSGVADIAPLGCSTRYRAALAPFERAALIGWRGERLVLVPEAQPYARAIAAAFDAFRQDGVRFSNAI